MNRNIIQKIVKLTWGNYTRLLKNRPLFTQSITTGVLMASGDVIAQIKFSSFETFDFWRNCKFFGVGTVVLGPWLRSWYLFLNKNVTGTNGIKAMKMVVVDQICMAPVIIFTLICLFAALDKATIQEIKSSLGRDYISILVNNYKLWPAAQMVNFYLIPLQFRVLYANFVSLIWNTYLSFAINKN